MRKDKKVISILLCTFLILGCCYYVKTYFKENLYNIKYGDMIKDGKYIYFMNVPTLDGESVMGTLFKASTDGKEVFPIKNAVARKLSIYKGKLYYIDYNGQTVNLCRISLDGSHFENIDTIGIRDYYINNDRIYYFYENQGAMNVCSCNLDLKDKKTIIKGINFFKMYKKKIYTASSINKDNIIVHEWDLNGKYLRKVCTIEGIDFEICDGKIYYCPFNMIMLGKNRTINKGSYIYSLNIKTGEKKTVIKDDVDSFSIERGKIYYNTVKIDLNVSENDDIQSVIYTPYVCNLDGTEKNRQDNKIAGTSCLDGKNLYYLDKYQNLVLRTNKDGEVKIIVPSIKLKNVKAGQ